MTSNEDPIKDGYSESVIEEVKRSFNNAITRAYSDIRFAHNRRFSPNRKMVSGPIPGKAYVDPELIKEVSSSYTMARANLIEDMRKIVKYLENHKLVLEK